MLSVFLHLALLGAVAKWSSGTPLLPPQRPIEWEIAEVQRKPKPVAPAEPKKKPEETKPPKQTQANPTRKPDVLPIPERPSALSTATAEPGNPIAPADLPQMGIPKRNLMPSMNALPVPSGGDESPHGHTIHPGDPEVDPKALALEAQHRGEERIKVWTEDLQAEMQTTKPQHPYIGALQGAFHEGLGQAPGGTAADLGTGAAAGMMKQYSRAAEAYGKSGAPGLGAPGIAPTQSERQAQLMGNDSTSLNMRAQTQAQETRQALQHKGPLYSMKLELVQNHSGEILELRILEGSGNDRFDAFVMRSMPDVVKRAGPPPADVFLKGKDTLRTQWSVEGSVKTSTSLEEKLGFQAGGMLGYIPTDPAVDAIKNNARFDYKARLLRWY